MVPELQRGFSYNIPLSPGVYELRLYFADLCDSRTRIRRKTHKITGTLQ